MKQSESNQCILTTHLQKMLKDEKYELNTISDKWKQGCRNYKLMIKLLIKCIQESDHYNTSIKQNLTYTNIFIAMKKNHKELKKEYKRCKKTDIEIINILNLSDKYETKDEIRKIKHQLDKNIKCLIAIRYHKKYDDLVDDIVSNLN